MWTNVLAPAHQNPNMKRKVKLGIHYVSGGMISCYYFPHISVTQILQNRFFISISKERCDSQDQGHTKTGF